MHMPSTVSRFVAKLVITSFLTQAILPAAYAADQIVNTSGGAAKTPIMDAATNGVPIVDITKANTSGVSHNLYQQFNVGTQGVILNNATTTAPTQLGGTIKANPLNGGVPAKIILNEVTGAASSLQGITEIAGSQAEFVLANPNGITCNGCGFINMSRASLVTGTPVYSGTNLTGFNISGGAINIGANGLNAITVNELDLLSRSLTLNGMVGTKNAYAITGLNSIDYSTLDATPFTNTTIKPTLAVDIALLGGMYGNQIYLLATEQGVGVNNRGRLEAQEGGLSLDVNGTLTNSGLLKSGNGLGKTDAFLVAKATSIQNTLGTVQADGLVIMEALQDLNNKATIVQADQVLLNAGGVLTSESSELKATKDVVLTAGSDLNIVAGSIEAGTNVSLLSGKDLDISPLVNTTSNTVYGTRTKYIVNTAGGWASQASMAGNTIYCSTSTASMATGAARPCSGPQTLAVQVPDGSSVTTTTVENTGSLISAGGDVDLQANKGSISMDAVSINAGSNITAQAQSIALFGSKDEKSISSYKKISGGFVSSASSDQTLVKGGLNAGFDVSLLATGDKAITGAAADMQGKIFVTGSNIISDAGHLSILGTGDVDIANDVTSHTTFYEYYQKKKSLFKKKTTHIISTTALGQIEPSFISAGSITIGADHDLNIVASDIIADNNVGLYAGNDLDILSTGEIYDSYNYHKVKTSGIFSSGGFGITIGSNSVTQRTTTDSLTQITSSVSSLNGDIYATAGNQYLQRSSELITPQGSINIAAKEAAIQSNNNTQSVLQSIQTKQTGLTIGISSPLLTAGQTIASVAEARKRTDDPRMQGLAALTAGLTAYQTFGPIKQFAQNPASIVDSTTISLTFGTSKTSFESLNKSSLPKESILTAGKDITITATGDKALEQGNISLVGALANADGNVTLKANNDINLAAAKGTTTEETKKKSSSASIGLTYNLQNGFAATVGVSNSRGFSNGWGTTYFPTELTAKKVLTVESGRNTTLKGATASGDSVIFNVGKNYPNTLEAGNLMISSPQDTSDYIAKESSSGFNISIPIPLPGVPATGVPSIGLSASDLKLFYDYQSAKQQTAIRAGAGGFDIKVNGHTQLDGGAIASTADASKNHLSTQTLDFTNLANRENTSGTSTAISLNLSADPNSIYSGSGVGTANINQSSYGATLAAIAPAEITITRPDLQLAKDKKYADVTRAPLVSALNSTNASIATLQTQKASAQQQVTMLTGPATVSGSVAYWQSRVATLQAAVGVRPSPPTERQCSMAGCVTVVITTGILAASYNSALAQYNNRVAAVSSANASLSTAQTALGNYKAYIVTVDTQLLPTYIAAQTAQQNAVKAVPDTGATLNAISRDPNTAHKPVKSVFDGTKATAQLNANASITMGFARAAYKSAGDYAQDRLDEATLLRGQGKEAEAKAIEEKWKEGGIGRTTLHAIIGGMAFGSDGAIAATANQLSQPIIAKIIQDAGITDTALVNTLKFAAATAVGAGVGGAQGAAASFDADANNRQLHYAELDLIKRLAENKAKKECTNEDCVLKNTVYWADLLQHTAESFVDDKDYVNNLNYLSTLLSASANPSSEGNFGRALQRYISDLEVAKQLLEPYMNTPIVINGKTFNLNGSPQTYFSATNDQAANSCGNTFLCDHIDPIYAGLQLRDANRVEAFGVLNGSAEPNYFFEELFLGGPLTNEAISLASRLWGRSAIKLSGETIASNSGFISVSQVTRSGINPILTAEEKNVLKTVTNALNSTAQGDIAEGVVNRYFTRNGFISVDGRCGSNCFDGVFVSGNKVFLVETKPLSANGSIKLRESNLQTQLPTQGSDAWVVNRLNLLSVGTPEQQATARLINNAMSSGNLTKVIVGYTPNDLTVIKLK